MELKSLLKLYVCGDISEDYVAICEVNKNKRNLNVIDIEKSDINIV